MNEKQTQVLALIREDATTAKSAWCLVISWFFLADDELLREIGQVLWDKGPPR